MAIFNSYVKLPEGKASICREIPHVYVHSNILGMSLHDMKQLDKKKSIISLYLIILIIYIHITYITYIHTHIPLWCIIIYTYHIPLYDTYIIYIYMSYPIIITVCIYICIINTIPYQADPRPSKGLGAAPWHALAFAQRHVGSISRSTSQKGGEGRQKKCLEHGTNRYSVPPKMALCYFNRDIICIYTVYILYIYIYHDFFRENDDCFDMCDSG